MMQFTATGAGTFENPRYDVQMQVADLFAGDEGIGQVRGRLSLRGQMLTMELDAESPRLSVTGSGRHRADARDGRGADAELLGHLARSLPALLRAAALAVHARRGGRHDPRRGRAGAPRPPVGRREGRLPQSHPLRLRAAQRRPSPADARPGSHRGSAVPPRRRGHRARPRRKRLACRQPDRARCLRRRQPGHPPGLLPRNPQLGRRLAARADSAARSPIRCFPGSADITNGRIRYAALPHSLQSINGHLTFDAQGIRVDERHGRARRRARCSSADGSA